MTTLLSAGLGYFRRGWSVIPVKGKQATGKCPGPAGQAFSILHASAATRGTCPLPMAASLFTRNGTP